MTLSTTIDLSGYKAAHEGAILYPIPDANYLRISGETRIDFLQRQTTNDLGLLSVNQALTNVLTSPMGRILDVFLMLTEPDTIVLLTLPGRGPATAHHFQKLIFFMDRVEVVDASHEFAQFHLDGPQASHLLTHVGLDSTPAVDQIVDVTIGDAHMRVIGRAGLIDAGNGAGYRLLVPTASAASISQTLADAGAEIPSAEAYHLLRIEAGLPGAAELTNDYTPLEANLTDAISSTKGCYTGQEVIARQISYDKVTRQLVGLRLPAPIHANTTVYADGRTAGTITSLAQSPRHGDIALAFIKRPHFAPGSKVTIGKDTPNLEAEVVSLPFGT